MEQILLAFTAPVAAAGVAIRDWLRREYSFSRSLIRRLRHADGLRVNGEAVPAARPLAAGDRVTLVLDEEPSPWVHPEPIPLAIVHEDPDLLVVNKPSGMLVHPVKGYRSGTLANGVAHHLAAAGLTAPVRPVQRLDRETSGLVCFAKNPWLHQRLAGRLEREYLAVAAGRLAADAGQLDGPIARDAGHPARRVVAAGGRRAVTHYRVLRRWAAATLLSVRLDTGRTHQIRVHLSQAGHPLLGDALYGGPCDLIQRQALHAARLQFTHPRTALPVAVAAPLPADLERLLSRLGPGDGGDTGLHGGKMVRSD